MSSSFRARTSCPGPVMYGAKGRLVVRVEATGSGPFFPGRLCACLRCTFS
jgi:hypothetical protein